MKIKINVLTYNISWATQINKVLGSEADFVKNCQKMYKNGGLKCHENAINNLKIIDEKDKIDLIALQEVNSEVEKKIMKLLPHISNFKKGKVNLAKISVLWNPEIFGKLIASSIFNLSDIKGDDRPCLTLFLKNNNDKFIIGNLHAPKNEGIFIKKEFNLKFNHMLSLNKNKKIKDALTDDSTKVIFVGDFNDDLSSINVDEPLILKLKKNIKLSHKKNKAQSKKTLKSCCWNTPRHPSKYFTRTGDYILVNKNIKQNKIYIPSIYRKKGRVNRMFSDHMPVMANITI